jgi:hypothetical protein
VTGRLLHFKFTSDFVGETTRQIDAAGSEDALLDPWYRTQLKRYRATVGQNEGLILARPESIKYSGPTQLVELGLMESPAEFRDWARQRGN